MSIPKLKPIVSPPVRSDPIPRAWRTFFILLWTFISLTAPPLISSCVFKDDVDESTTDHKKNVGWNNNLGNFEKVVESGIHQTNDEGFNHNSLNWSLHLQYLYIYFLSPPSPFVFYKTHSSLPKPDPTLKWTSNPSLLKLPLCVPNSNNYRVNPVKSPPARGSRGRGHHAAMVLSWVPPTVVCTLGLPRSPNPPAPVRSPSPRRLSLSIPTPLGSLTPTVPSAKPTGIVWIPPSPSTILRVPMTLQRDWENYCLVRGYVERPRACDPHIGSGWEWSSFGSPCNEKNCLIILNVPRRGWESAPTLPKFPNCYDSHGIVTCTWSRCFVLQDDW